MHQTEYVIFIKLLRESGYADNRLRVVFVLIYKLRAYARRRKAGEKNCFPIFIRKGIYIYYGHHVDSYEFFRLVFRILYESVPRCWWCSHIRDHRINTSAICEYIFFFNNVISRTLPFSCVWIILWRSESNVYLNSHYSCLNVKRNAFRITDSTIRTIITIFPFEFLKFRKCHS